jgi:archaellum biogenesis ATPase FlaH
LKKSKGEGVEKNTEELLELLGARGKLKAKLHAELKNTPEPFQLLLLEESDTRLFGLLEVVGFLVQKNYVGTVVSLNRPTVELVEFFKKERFPVEKFSFVDAITIQSKGKKLGGENFVYLESLKDLVEMSVQIDKMLSRLQGEKKFLLFDSLTTLLVYNEKHTVEKFLHATIGKLRARNASGIFLLAAHAEQEVLDAAKGFCDKVIRI